MPNLVEVEVGLCVCVCGGGGGQKSPFLPVFDLPSPRNRPHSHLPQTFTAHLAF